jgi:hypothetical protein
MRIGEFEDFFRRALVKKKRVLTLGKPGVGKTFVRESVCKALGYDYIGVTAPLMSPVKIGGYPRAPLVEGGDATHALFDGIARAFRATKPTHLHIDDLGMANGETLKAIVDLVQFGRIDNRTLPDCVVVGASSNDVGHGADVQGMIEPLKSRWNTIVEVECFIDDTVIYGLNKGWPACLLGYLRNDNEALHDWKPSKSMKIDGACPRGWEYVAEWINDGFDDPEVIAGCVGKGRATAYLAYRGLVNQLPDINAIMADPEGALVPEKADVKYFVAMALASKIKCGTFGPALRYLNRLPQPFRAFSVRDAIKAESAKSKAGTLPDNYKPIHFDRDYVAWSCTKDGQEVVSAASTK